MRKTAQEKYFYALGAMLASATEIINGAKNNTGKLNSGDESFRSAFESTWSQWDRTRSDSFKGHLKGWFGWGRIGITLKLGALSGGLANQGK